MINRTLFSLLIAFTVSAVPVRAVVDPTSANNNRIGIHIFNPDEIFDAAKLVNSSGGDWGYVTVPIRSDERDFSKWYAFFQNTRKLHVIPIVRLLTYVDGDKWVAPNSYDLVDWANFLNGMPWPVKNRYIILYNEPNHSQEWGGQVSPHEYATLLMEARRIFKDRSDDFFLLSAGLDMSVPQSATSYDALRFYREMSQLQPEWYQAIDGLSVHAYPNPAFSASPYTTNRFGIRSYQYEVNLLTSLGYAPKPIFITETGSKWESGFYKAAITEVWNDPHIVAITPFVLFAGSGDFAGFSLLDPAHQPRPAYREIFEIPKIAGSPLLNHSFDPLNPTLPSLISTTPLPKSPTQTFWDRLSRLVNPPDPTVVVAGSTIIKVDIADTPAKQARGLSYRTSLASDRGMLFIFPRPGPQRFWMNEMNFALDFIWIRDGKVVEVHENIQPPSQTGGKPVFIVPVEHADSVVEVNAGFIKTHGIKVGDSVMVNSR